MKEFKDIYEFYKLTLDEVNEIENKWFQFKIDKNKDKIYNNTLVSLKRCDLETSMYNYAYNPVSLAIKCPLGAKFKQNDKEQDLYNMRCSICSIDDSSFTIWFEQIPLNQLYFIRSEIQKWIYELNEINGNKFLDYLQTLGANPDTINYD